MKTIRLVLDREIKIKVWFLLLVLILGLSIVVYANMGTERAFLMPDVTGLYPDNAVEIIQSVGLGIPEIIVDEASSGTTTSTPDKVIEQMPVGGSEVKKGAVIKIIVSNNK